MNKLQNYLDEIKAKTEKYNSDNEFAVRLKKSIEVKIEKYKEAEERAWGRELPLEVSKNWGAVEALRAVNTMIAELLAEDLK